MTKQWHILGRGAIGLLWAQQLERQKVAVQLVIKGLKKPRQQTISLTRIDNSHYQFEVSLSKHSDKSAISHLIVPLKAYDVLQAIVQVKHRLTPDALIVLCHNGMGTIDPVRQLLSHSQTLVFATTTHGALKADNYQVVHTGLGETKMGWISGRPDKQQQCMLSQMLTPVGWQQDIEQVLWQKLAINCVINPLSAIENCRNGQLGDESYKPTIILLCEEISRVANACGISLPPETLIENSYKVINATAANYSSMNRDVASARQTEIDFITGYLLHKANQHQIAVPNNQALYEAVKSLSNMSLT